MSTTAVDQLLACQVERLTESNAALVVQNERLACMLAEALDILDKFQHSAKDKLRHYSLDRKLNGKFDPKKLRNR